MLKACGLAAIASPLFRSSRVAAAGTTRPRFYLQIIPQGGMDSIYTVDPKTTNEVEAGVDVPFAASEIIESNGSRLGPCFKPLAKWLPQVAIVNAVRQNSANHLSGLANVLRCKTATTVGTPSLLEIIGSRRQREATGAINIGTVMNSAFSPAFLGSPDKLTFGDRPGLFEHLEQADPQDLVDAAKALRREAEPLRKPRASDIERVSGDNLVQAADLFDAMAKAPRFKPIDWPLESEAYYKHGRDLQRALWMFENGLTRCVVLCICGQDFDTHLENDRDQRLLNDYLGGLLDLLFGELTRRIVDGKPMSQQTLVMVGSEIGRYPRLNSSRGKDHFPQASHLFFGSSVAAGTTYGATAANLVSMPISLSTGRPQKTGGHLLRVDDVGTTLLALDGADPERFGYSGERMEFLVG